MATSRNGFLSNTQRSFLWGTSVVPAILAYMELAGLIDTGTYEGIVLSFAVAIAFTILALDEFTRGRSIAAVVIWILATPNWMWGFYLLYSLVG